MVEVEFAAAKGRPLLVLELVLLPDAASEAEIVPFVAGAAEVVPFVDVEMDEDEAAVVPFVDVEESV